jgi:ABC-type sugar transport system, ATPase component
MKNITKTFPGVKALDNVNLKVEEGEIHALVGENGAGKSTLMNILSGIYPYGSYDGNIIYNGEECKFKGIKDSERLGIVIIHQELALVPYLTIAENMFLGNENGKKFAIDWDKGINPMPELTNCCVPSDLRKAVIRRSRTSASASSRWWKLQKRWERT